MLLNLDSMNKYVDYGTILTCDGVLIDVANMYRESRWTQIMTAGLIKHF